MIAKRSFPSILADCLFSISQISHTFEGQIFFIKTQRVNADWNVRKANSRLSLQCSLCSGCSAERKI